MTLLHLAWPSANPSFTSNTSFQVLLQCSFPCSPGLPTCLHPGTSVSSTILSILASVSLFTCLNHCNLLSYSSLFLSFKQHLWATSTLSYHLIPTIHLATHTRLFGISSFLLVLANVSAPCNTTDLTHTSHILPLLFSGILLFTNKLAVSPFFYVPATLVLSALSTPASQSNTDLS